MGGVIGQILPSAIGVAISPVPIIAVILMLFSKKARSNGPAFLGGWVLGLAVVGTVVLILAAAGKVSAGGAPSTASYVIKLLLGLLFLAMAARQWKSRPKEGEQPAMPKWMAGIDAFTTGKSFGLAFLLSAVNPKNLALTLAAALTIAQAGLSDGQEAAALIVFILIASLTVGIPVLYYLAAGAAAQKTLDGWKSWLLANNATVMVILLLVLGVMLVGQGFGGLTG
jgi:threonine/homoserine/homoserine lactone efflux protein